MNLKLTLSQGIISGNDVRDLIRLALIDESLFRQRKSYDEYYFDGNEREMQFPARRIFIIADRFPVEIYGDSIKIICE